MPRVDGRKALAADLAAAGAPARRPRALLRGIHSTGLRRHCDRTVLYSSIHCVPKWKARSVWSSRWQTPAKTIGRGSAIGFGASSRSARKAVAARS